MYISKFYKTSKSIYNLLILLILTLVLIGISIPAIARSRVRITNGPFLLRVYSDRAALMWETDHKNTGKLYYGKDPQLKNLIISQPTAIKYEVKQNKTSTITKNSFLHKLWLKHLEPAQQYSYRITTPHTQSRIYTFRTTPVDTNEVKFIVYGDSRSNPDTHRKLVEQMIKEKVDFVIHAGDLVNKGNCYEQWRPQFFEPLKGLAETVPIYVAKGNHDIGNDYFEKLLIPDGEKNNFGLKFGPLYYFCADNVSKNTKSEDLLNTIVDNIQDNEARWTFVSYHKPSLNFGGHSSMWGYPKALPRLALSGTDFVITSHSHLYERFQPIVSDVYALTCITSGGGGAPMYDIEPTNYHGITKKEHHFCLFHIKDGKLTMDTINTTGQIIDHLELIKTSDQLNKQYLHSAVALEAISLYQGLRKAQQERLPAKSEKH